MGPQENIKLKQMCWFSKGPSVKSASQWMQFFALRTSSHFWWDKMLFLFCQCVKTESLRTCLLWFAFHATTTNDNRATVRYYSLRYHTFSRVQFSACASDSHSNVLEGVKEQQLSSAPCPLKAGSHCICRTSLLRNILDLLWAWWKVCWLVESFTFALCIRQSERRGHKDPQQQWQVTDTDYVWCITHG